MSNRFARGRRVQHVYFVQDNDEIVIHFTHPDWIADTKMTLTSENGVVSIEIEQALTLIKSQLTNLKGV